MSGCPGPAPPQTAHWNAPHPDCPECGEDVVWEGEADADREARRADSAERIRDEALAALRPFAAAADGFEEYEWNHELASGWKRVTVDHLRRARKVLGLYGDRS